MKTSNKIVLASFAVLIIIAVIWQYNKNYSNNPDYSILKTKRSKNSKTNNLHNLTIPALAAQVKLEDVPIIIEALGTITANKQAIVHSRVDGLLESINFKEGSIVKQGQIIAKIDARAYQSSLNNAKGQLAKDEAQLDIAKLDLQRYKTLLEQDSIAKQQVDMQNALVKQLQGIIASDRANLNTAKLNLSFTNITAPISGRIGLSQVDMGNLVRANDANGIAVITEINPIAAIFSLPQANLAAVVESFDKNKSRNQSILAQVIDRNGETIISSGKVAAIDNQADASTGSIKIKALFDNKDNKLFTGQFVNIRLTLDTLKNVPVISQSAIQKGSVGTFVYVINNNKANIRKITINNNFDDKVVVSQGLKEGETIVIDGIDKLKDGANVSIIQPLNPIAKPVHNKGYGHLSNNDL